jgi:hypothetical protein
MSCCTGSSAYKTEEAACEVQPAVLVNSIRAQHPSKSRQGVAGMAKRLLVEEEAEERHEQLCRLPTQGAMARRLEGSVCEL